MFLFGSAGGNTSYKVQRSVRLRQAASAYFSRTQAAGNQTTWTWSAWVKLGQLSGLQYLFHAGGSSGSGVTYNVATNDFQIEIGNGTTQYFVRTTANKRDPSAWQHVVAVADTNNATSTSRLRIFVNGELQAIGTSSYPTSGFAGNINNSGVGVSLGRWNPANYYFDGYLSEINFIDGQALTPSAFGEQDSATRMWVPKKYTGSYGANGFYLDFSDITSTTTLGYDKSGNNNHWTANNISLTAGVTYDSMLDVPGLSWADGGTGRGNYCTLNPLTGAGLLSEGNLKVQTALDGAGAFGTIALPTTGKWYWEYVQTAYYYIDACFCGIATLSGTSHVRYFGYDGTKYIDGAGSSYGSAYSNNVVIGVAVDVEGGYVTFYRNGVSQGAIPYSFAGKELFPWFGDGSGGAQSDIVVNFGQRPFAYTPPSGHKALQLGNLPAPTGAAAKPWGHFDAITWLGNNVNNRTISGLGHQPGFVWPKARSAAYDAMLFDVVRGTGKSLTPSSTGAETTNSVNGYISAFTADGFTLTQGTSSIVSLNETNTTYVAWSWKAGGAPVTNTAGSITSQVSANTAAGFSIVTFTMPASGDFTVGHGLGVPPKLIIEKQRSNIGGWPVWVDGFSKDEYIYLNQTVAKGSATNSWGASTPTSSVFGMRAGTLAGSLNTQVAYCFAEVPGFSKIGTYIGNSDNNGTFVYCGFKPKLVLIKRIDAAGNWLAQDAARSPFNVSDAVLYPNASSAEQVSQGYRLDLLSNGFKLRGAAVEQNQNSGSYVYIAFAEAPFQYANAR